MTKCGVGVGGSIIGRSGSWPMAFWCGRASGYKKAPALTIPQVQGRRCSSLPRREFEAPAALASVADWQQRNHAADGSHRRRRIARLNELGQGSL
jgi:hypothetical protein